MNQGVEFVGGRRRLGTQAHCGKGVVLVKADQPSRAGLVLPRGVSKFQRAVVVAVLCAGVVVRPA
eukprot:9076659-Pyramimonas_sp.AAC.1